LREKVCCGIFNLVIFYSFSVCERPPGQCFKIRKEITAAIESGVVREFLCSLAKGRAREKAIWRKRGREKERLKGPFEEASVPSVSFFCIRESWFLPRAAAGMSDSVAEATRRSIIKSHLFFFTLLWWTTK